MRQWHLLKISFIEGSRAWKPVIKSSAGILFLLLFVSEGLYQYFDFVLEMTKGHPNLQFQANLGKAATGMLESGVLVLFIPYRAFEFFSHQAKNKTLAQILKEYGAPLLTEFFRAAARIILWSLLFIIPGLFKQIRFSFFPFIVMFDPAYDRGEVDALRHSNSLIKGMTPAVTLLLLVAIFADVAFDGLPYALPFLKVWVYRIFAAVATMAIAVLMHCWMVALYLKRANLPGAPL